MKKIFTALVLSGLFIFALPSQVQASFLDVPNDHPGRVAIEFLQERGVISGADDGNFYPDQLVNRAELLKIALNSADISSDTTTKLRFPDVNSGQWFYKFVCEGVKRDIIKGYSDGTFQPAKTVNRVEALKMLIKTHGIVTQKPDTNVATDVMVSDWYSEFVSYAVNSGILGIEAGVFFPEVGMRRSEIAELTYRLMMIREGKGSQLPPYFLDTTKPGSDLVIKKVGGSRQILADGKGVSLLEFTLTPSKEDMNINLFQIDTSYSSLSVINFRLLDAITGEEFQRVSIATGLPPEGVNGTVGGGNMTRFKGGSIKAGESRHYVLRGDVEVNEQKGGIVRAGIGTYAVEATTRAAGREINASGLPIENFLILHGTNTNATITISGTPFASNEDPNLGHIDLSGHDIQIDPPAGSSINEIAQMIVAEIDKLSDYTATMKGNVVTVSYDNIVTGNFIDVADLEYEINLAHTNGGHTNITTTPFGIYNRE